MIISIANQKGGVGKTTTTMNLGAALAKEGKRVLLVDSDPQGNLTSYLGVRLGEEAYSAAGTLDEVYLSKRPFDTEKARGLVLRTLAGVDLIPADGNLSGVEYYLFSRAERESVLRRFLGLLGDDYDFILIDTPPSLNLLTLNALVASDRILVPVQPEFFSLEGIVKIRETVDRVRESWNPELAIVGILPTQVAARRRLTREVIEALQGEMGDTLFKATIAENAAVSESSGQGKSVLDYARSSKGAQDYTAAARELIERVSPA